MDGLILKASAGTGKTYRLSLEYIKLLLEKKRYDEILVITFTRKATAEIRERIFEHLQTLCYGEKSQKEEIESNILQLGLNNFDYEYLKKVYSEIVLNREKIKIFTIDGLINNIFKKAVAPYLNIYNYEIIDDKQNEASVDSVLQKILENRSYFKEIWEFFDKNVERDIENYYAFIKKILEIRWKYLLIKESDKKVFEFRDFIKDFKEIAFLIIKIMEEKGKTESLEDCLKKEFRDYYLEEDDLKLEKDIKDNYSDFLKSDNIWNLRKVKKLKADSEIVEDMIFKLESTYKTFQKKLAERIYSDEILKEEKLILRLGEMIFKIYDEIKFSEKRFTHSDILNYTFRFFFEEDLNLVKDGVLTEDFSMIMGSKINDLLVDEFQDTSILQWNILYPLVRSANRAVFVGDGKQSIYGWRGGEKELFEKLSNITGAKEETLGKSYRSHKEIIEFVNDFFSSIEMMDYSNVDYLESKNSGSVYCEVFDKESDEKALNAMIDSIENRIENYGKAAIICRKNKEIEEISLLLEEKGIPYIKESSLSILEHRAVKPYYMLLRYLHYGDQFDLMRFLRSDIVFADSDIIKELVKNSIDSIEDKNIKKVLELKNMEFELLAERVTEYFPQNEQYKTLNDSKNFMSFFYLMKNYKSLDDFILFLEENSSSEVLAQQGVEELNAVRLITIHKSKGLEFENVYYYFTPVSRSRPATKEIKFYSEFSKDFQSIENYLFMVSRYKYVLKHIGFDFDENESLKELEEEFNNLYVAITRPKKNLFFYIDYGKKIEDVEKITESKIKSNSDRRYYIYSSAIKKAMGIENLSKLRDGIEIGYFRESPKDEESVNLKEIRDFKEYIFNEIEEIEDSEEIKTSNLISQKRGLLVHYYLSNIFHNSEDEKDRAYRLAMIKYGNMLGESEIKSSIEKAAKIIEDYSEKYIDIFDKRWNVKNEFVIYDKELGMKRIDRLMIDSEKKEIVILDYKTGFTKEQVQLDEYEKLIRDRVGAQYIIKTYFVSLSI